MTAAETVVEVVPATPADRPALGNMMQLYIHDFSAFWNDRSEGELGEDGRFDDYPLDAYWQDADHIPLLLRQGGHPVGFALIDAHSHTGRPLDRNVAEFFVTRKHRRNRVGTVAARAIFTLYPGIWETAVARRNTDAFAFWRELIINHPQARDIEELSLDTADWNGPLFRFRIEA